MSFLYKRPNRKFQVYIAIGIVVSFFLGFYGIQLGQTPSGQVLFVLGFTTNFFLIGLTWYLLANKKA